MFLNICCSLIFGINIPPYLHDYYNLIITKNKDFGDYIPRFPCDFGDYIHHFIVLCNCQLENVVFLQNYSVKYTFLLKVRDIICTRVYSHSFYLGYRENK